MRTLLLIAFLATSVFAATIGTEVGYVDISDVNFTNGKYVITSSKISATATSTKTFTPLNYTINVKPKNLEKLAKDLEVPLTGELNWTIPEGQTESIDFEIPDLVCGKYTISGEAYYNLNGTLRKYANTLVFELPCKSVKASIVAKIVSIIPYSVLKGVAGMFGFKF